MAIVKIRMSAMTLVHAMCLDIEEPIPNSDNCIVYHMAPALITEDIHHAVCVVPRFH